MDIWPLSEKLRSDNQINTLLRSVCYWLTCRIEALTVGRSHRAPDSLRPTSSMPSPMPLNNLSTSSAPALAPFAAPLPTFLTASTDACAPSFSWVTDQLAAPSTQAPAFLSALLGSLPDFFASSAVLCQALASS